MSETHKLAATLAADVVGSSRLIGADEGRALRGDLTDPAIDAHHGRIVKAHRRRLDRRVSKRGGRGALCGRSADRHGRVQFRSTSIPRYSSEES
jgi:hypothetical protein